MSQPSINELIQDLRTAKRLFRPDWDKRIAATKRLGELRATEAVGDLAAVIRENENADLCLAAVPALGQIGDAKAIDTLAHLIQDKARGELHRAAITVLGTIGDERAAAALIGAWEKADTPQREAIETVLVQLGPERTSESLIASLGDPSSPVRQVAGKVLRQFSSITPRLVAALGHDDARVRDEVRILLIQRGTRAISDLVAALGQADDHVREGAAEALGQMGALPVADLIPVATGQDVRAADAAAGALVRIGKPAVKPLITACASQSQGIDVLIRMKGTVQSVLAEAQAGDVPLLITTLGMGDSDLKQGALDALVRIGAPSVSALLALLGSSDPDNIRTAHAALAAMGEKAVGPLIASLADPGLEQKATDLLIAMGNAALPALFKRLGEPGCADRDRIVDIMCAISGTDRLTLALDQYRERVRFLMPCYGDTFMARALGGDLTFQERMCLEDEYEEPIGQWPLDEKGAYIGPDAAMAMPQLRALTAIAPGFALPHYWLGQWYLLKLQDVEKAIHSFEQATQCREFVYEHRQAKSYWWLGVSYGASSPCFDYEKSLACFERAVELGLDERPVCQAIQDTAQTAINRCLAEGKHPQLLLPALRKRVEALSAWLEQEPELSELEQVLETAKGALKEVEEAYHNLGEVAAFKQMHSKSVVSQALRMSRSGQAAQAVDLLQGVVREQPTNKGATLAFAEALLRSGRVREGLSQFRQAMQHGPDVQMRFLPVYDDVCDAIDQALDALLSQRRYSDAMGLLADWEALASVPDTFPGNTREVLSTMHTRLGYRYHKIAGPSGLLEAYERMVSCAETAFSLSQDSYTVDNLPMAHRNIARYYGGKGQWNQAIPHLERAVKVAPDFGDGWWLLSIAYSQLQDDRAIGCMMRAVELGDENAIRALRSMSR